MRIYVACVLLRYELETAKTYREEFAGIGFELLPMSVTQYASPRRTTR